MHSRAPQTLVAFELQTFQGGAWKIDSLYDERQIALDMAKRLLDSRRAAAVRIVEETFTDGDEIKSRVVFRQSLVDRGNAEATERKIQVQREVREARENRPAPAARAPAARQAQGALTSGFTWLLVKLIGISVFGLVMIFVLSRMILHH